MADEATEGGQATMARPRGRRRPIGWYVLSAVSLVGIIALAVALQALLRPRVTRPPSEFLPASMRVALGVEARPDGEAMKRMQAVWKPEDVRQLSERAIGLCQEAVGWTGLKLDLRTDATWFGGEAVVGATGKGLRPLDPRSVVLIARTTSERRARASLDRAVKPMAGDLGWRRFVARRAGGSVIVWRDEIRQDQMAYAVRDGCVIVSPSLEVVEACLTAGRDPKRRLTATEAFQRGVRSLPTARAMWAYFDVGFAGEAAEYVLPVLQHGWRGLGHGYRRWMEQPSAKPVKNAGALMLALSPEPDGVRVKGVYARAPGTKAESTPNRLAELGLLLPKETAAYALVHGSGRLIRTQRGFAGIPFLVVPNDVMMAMLPRADGAESGRRRPALVLAAPTAELAGPTAMAVAAIVKHPVSEAVGEFTVIASDAQALAECKAALKDAGQRLMPRRGEKCLFDVWAEPGRLSEAAGWLRELGLKGWESAGGGEGELTLKAEPKRLLGGATGPGQGRGGLRGGRRSDGAAGPEHTALSKPVG